MGFWRFGLRRKVNDGGGGVAADGLRWASVGAFDRSRRAAASATPSRGAGN